MGLRPKSESRHGSRLLSISEVARSDTDASMSLRRPEGEYEQKNYAAAGASPPAARKRAAAGE
jgi:hypothetical protein